MSLLKCGDQAINRFSHVGLRMFQQRLTSISLALHLVSPNALTTYNSVILACHWIVQY